ncbi:trypco2 family protein [Streptomyces sp. NPDC006655]|uniref:trypco2 family protein n=1 Tax=Streptomyces sp. NPDC006655 TaxID=3156898 RepID=UPI003454BC5E
MQRTVGRRSEGRVIELSELISELRRELQNAMVTAADQSLRFELGPVELETTVLAAKEAGGRGTVRFWVVEAGGDGRLTHSSTHRVRLTLQPRVSDTGEVAYIHGSDQPGER